MGTLGGKGLKPIFENDINDIKSFLFFEKSATIREYTVGIVYM